MQRKYITGIKGILSIQVVIFHLLICFYPMLYFADVEYGGGGQMVGASPLFFFYNGSFAVYVFWIISGYLLSLNYLKSYDSDDIKSKAFRRFPRLFIPVSVAVLEGFFLVVCGAAGNREAAVVCSNGSGWLSAIFPQTASIKRLVLDICFTYSGGYSNYNAPIWTIKTEFIGSFIVFIVLGSLHEKKIKKRILIYFISLFILAIYPELCSFLFGIILAELDLENIKIKWNKAYTCSCLILGGLFGGVPVYISADFFPYQVIQTVSMSLYKYFYVLGAFLIMMAIIKSRLLKKILENKLFILIGKLSMSIYLVHFPIIMSVGMRIFLKLFSGVGLGYHLSAAITAASCLSIIMFVALLFYKYIDKSANTFSWYLFKKWNVA